MTSIKNLKKPLSAFQYYIQEWKNLTDEEKEKFQQMASLDKQRYDNEKNEIIRKQEEETMKKNIYLTAYLGGYSAVGLDNGAKSYETVGPICNIINYSEEEQQKWGVKAKAFEYYDKNYNIKMTLYHNEKYYKYTQYGDSKKKGSNVYTHGKSYNARKDHGYNPNPKKYTISNKKQSGTTTTHYTSFSNETWETNY